MSNYLSQMIVRGYLLIAYNRSPAHAIVAVAKALKQEKFESDTFFEVMNQTLSENLYKEINKERFVNAIEEMLAVEVGKVPFTILVDMAEAFYEE